MRASGAALLPQERSDVLAVDHAVVGRLGAGEAGERRQEVHRRDHFRAGAAGGEYWGYPFVTSTVGSFSGNRLAFGFNGARHYAAVVYSFADSSAVCNPAAGEDLRKSLWITGQYTTNYYLAADPDNSRSIDHALASHAALACRAGIYDRKYLETLRQLAHASGSAEDVAFVEGIGASIDKLGRAGKGGADDFTAELTDESGPRRLRRRIVERIRALLAGK